MTTPTAVMTKLDAVNQMLASIGQSPVNTITGTLPKDASKAIIALDTTLREVLNMGWSFNTDTDYPITPDLNGNILIPSNALWVDPVDRHKDLVQRWNNGTPMMYDRDERTFEFTEALDFDIIWAFDYEEIPQVARHYIAMRAGRIYQSQIVGSDLLFQFTAQHEAEAHAALKRLEKRTKRYNILDNNHQAERRFNMPRR